MLLDYRDQQNIVNSTLMHFMKDTLRDFIDLVVLGLNVATIKRLLALV